MEFCRLVSHVLLQMSRRRQKREVGYAREWNAAFLCHTYNEIPRVDENGECTNAQTHNAFGGDVVSSISRLKPIGEDMERRWKGDEKEMKGM